VDVDRGLAGRLAELVQVAAVLGGLARRGVLLVLGEADIGKSRLVRAATSDARLGGVLVLDGTCLPMGTGMPLLPFGDIIRMAHQVDGGHWVTAALADCPRYSSESVALLVPELGDPAGRQPAAATADGYPWWRQQLFASVRAMFAALGRARAAALVIEDVHWADTSTLELLDYLLRPGHQIGLPVVLTFRSEDAETPKQNASWLASAKRSDLVDVLRLGALSRRETAEQIELLTGQAPDPTVADAVFRRSEGNALFTEQLVGPEASSPLAAALPDDLLELLGARIGELDPDAQTTVRVLAIAGRPLEAQMLMAVTGLSHDDLSRALRDLKSRRLLRSGEADGRHALRHVLLGEAVVADLLPVERVETNRRLAISLTASGGPGLAAEVAAHWREAGSMEEELHWQVRAARDADAVYANEQASAHWLRAIELWDRAAEPEGCADSDLASLYAAAEDALEFAGHSDRACALAEAAFGRLAAVASGSAKAELYLRLGYFQGATAVQQGLGPPGPGDQAV
jgi:hypothetical protein